MEVEERALYKELDEALVAEKKSVEADGYDFSAADALGAIAPILRKYFFEDS